jgi:cardiolipin synthase
MIIKLLPNFLSALRIVLAFFLFISIRAHHPVTSFWIVLAAGVTDFLDGYFARRLNQISALGGLLDPLADKVFFGTLFVALLLQDSLPLWVFAVFIVRDVLLLMGTAFIKMKHITYEFTPTFLSKINTALQFAFGLIAVLYPDSGILLVLVGIILVTTLLSGFLYFLRFSSTVFE